MAKRTSLWDEELIESFNFAAEGNCAESRKHFDMERKDSYGLSSSRFGVLNEWGIFLGDWRCGITKLSKLLAALDLLSGAWTGALLTFRVKSKRVFCAHASCHLILGAAI